MATTKANKVERALALLNEKVAEGYVYRNAFDMIRQAHNLKPAEANELGYRFDTQDGSKDRNGRFRIFDITLKHEDDSGMTNVRVYLLHPGDNFDRFGGHRNGLTVLKTASLIVRTTAYGTSTDREYPMHGLADTWAWIQRLILREAGVKVPDEE